MAARGVLRTTDDGRPLFHCPGCDALHGVGVGEGAGPRWIWNGSFDKPTFTPSVLVRSGRAVDPGFQPEPDDPPEVCHSFVMVGRMHFLGDCTHALAGETVDLPRLDIGHDG